MHRAHVQGSGSRDVQRASMSDSLITTEGMVQTIGTTTMPAYSKVKVIRRATIQCSNTVVKLEVALHAASWRRMVATISLVRHSSKAMVKVVATNLNMIMLSLNSSYGMVVVVVCTNNLNRAPTPTTTTSIKINSRIRFSLKLMLSRS